MQLFPLIGKHSDKKVYENKLLLVQFFECIAPTEPISVGATAPTAHRRRKGSVVGGHHGECGARAYNGGPGAGPLVRGAKTPEAESILVIGYPAEPANLAPVRENSMFCYGPLGSELGGPECMVPPQPRHWAGRCPLRLRRRWQ